MVSTRLSVKTHDAKGRLAGIRLVFSGTSAAYYNLLNGNVTVLYQQYLICSCPP